MGSSGSKACVNESTTALSSKRPRPSRANTWLFQSSCLGAGVPSGSRQREKESGGSQSETESVKLKIECDREEKDEVACISNNDELDGWGDASITSMNGNGTGSSSSRSSSAPGRFLSRFSFIPGNLSFRLSRAASLGSSRGRSTDDRIDSQHGTTSINFLDNLQEIQARDDGVGNNRVGSTDGTMCSPRAINELDNGGTRVSDRRIGAREPVERNVRFSRTLSVGRLRDRVLRRSSLSDAMFCPLEHERQVREASQSSDRNAFTGNTGLSSTPADNGRGGISPLTSSYSPSSASSSLFGVQDHEVETSRPREARYHDLLEHRSNFLERRRRIRSQVRALQRLGSRFENLSGHERSCILSGQHRTGRCTCRVGNRDANSSDETGTRASISRIVMLAEALFEVLDEIHQQSVVLSSQPSVSSIGSIPAPNEVVESLPVNFYAKSQKYHNEEVALCYICLVEYEEGDSVRVLPCHHEFHRTCVDKWLKEIHRVCPLCRGDICKPDSLPSED